MIRYMVGDKEYYQVTVPNCLTCNHPLRPWIEEKIIYGYSYKVICSQIQELVDQGAEIDGFEVTALKDVNLRNHYTRGHMNVEASVKRRIIEERANQLGKDVDAEVAPLPDPWSISRLGMQAAFEKLQSNEMPLEAKDLVAFTKLHNDINNQLEGNTSVTKQNIMDILTAARRNMTPKQWVTFLDEIDNNEAFGIVERQAQALPTTTEEI